jgi:hypothetical protein
MKKMLALPMKGMSPNSACGVGEPYARTTLGKLGGVGNHVDLHRVLKAEKRK